jgi:CHAD domain
VRAGLAALAESAAQADDRQLRTERAVDLFRAGSRHVARAKLDAKGWAAVGPGVERTYRAGRRALADARRDTDPTVMHEWRKRAKDAWYHVRLLRDAAPSVLEPLDDRFHQLSDALGDGHDLVVISDRLRALPVAFGGAAQVRAVCELAERRRNKLERRATRLGACLYAEEPSRYADRIGAYWHLWHEMGDEKPAGGLAELFPPTDDLDDLDLEQLRDRAGRAALPAHLYPSKAQLIGELRAAGAT